MRTLPANMHNIAALESALTLNRAFASRRAQLIAQVDAAALVGRTLAQPSMAWVDGPRTQPRGPNGRFLPRTWHANAELFLPADRAWFRTPIGAL